MDSLGVQYYHEVALTIPSTETEVAADYIIEHISGGILLEDEENDLSTTIRFYVADGIDISAKLDGLKAYLATFNPAHGGLVFRRKRIKNLDWIEAYRESVVPVFVGESIVIVPPWNNESFPGRVRIVIEPKMAFGTGRHESTQGSLAELEKMNLSGRSMLDLGCGSGVLGIYAAKQGAASVVGYDIDPLAVENSWENYIINGVESICRAELGSIDDVASDRRFDVIAVNIIKSVIVPMLGRLKGHLVQGGGLVLAGLLEQDRQEIDAALAEHGLNSHRIRTDGEWLTYSVTS